VEAHFRLGRETGATRIYYKRGRHWSPGERVALAPHGQGFRLVGPQYLINAIERKLDGPSGLCPNCLHPTTPAGRCPECGHNSSETSAT